MFFSKTSDCSKILCGISHNLFEKSHNSDEFDMIDVAGILRETTRQDELFDYVDEHDYLKERVRDYEYEKDNFELSM